MSKFRWITAEQFGVDPVKFFSALFRLPRFVLDWFLFRKKYQGAMELMPCLHDRHSEGGDISDEYFWQDLYVARLIRAAAPRKHVDVGSRVDGFVAHVASFRDIEVFDIRPLSQDVPGVTFRQADLMVEQDRYGDYCDSVSCLHALEHFGLGRYGDPLDPDGFDRGLNALVRMLVPGGLLYLSVPVGRERVVFNAHRVFNPVKLLSDCAAKGLQLQSLTAVLPGGRMQEARMDGDDIAALAKLDYALAVMVFSKKSASL